MVYRPRWRDWEVAVVLLVIDWYTVAGSFAPDLYVITPIIRKWIEFQNQFEPDIEKSDRLIGFPGSRQVQPQDGLGREFIRRKWVAMKSHKLSRDAAIAAIASRIFPRRALIEQALNIRICYHVNDRLPGHDDEPATTDANGIVTPGTYRMKRFLNRRNVLGVDAKMKEARDQRESAYCKSHGLTGDWYTHTASNPEIPADPQASAVYQQQQQQSSYHPSAYLPQMTADTQAMGSFQQQQHQSYQTPSSASSDQYYNQPHHHHHHPHHHNHHHHHHDQEYQSYLHPSGGDDDRYYDPAFLLSQAQSNGDSDQYHDLQDLFGQVLNDVNNQHY
jgi:hypothetical protein